MFSHHDHDGAEDRAKIINFEGRPRAGEKEGEIGRWNAFKRLFSKIGRLKLGFSALGVKAEADYQHRNPGNESAEEQQARAGAEKLAKEAAEVQERIDMAPVEKAARVNDELRKVFNDDKTPDDVKLVQMMNLMEADPKIAEQIQKVADLYSHLTAVRGGGH